MEVNAVNNNLKTVDLLLDESIRHPRPCRLRADELSPVTAPTGDYFFSRPRTNFNAKKIKINHVNMFFNVYNKETI